MGMVWEGYFASGGVAIFEFRMKRFLSLAFAVGSAVFLATATASAATRLFILSGQSNMAALDPEVSFIPTLKAAFPADDLIVE